MYYVHQPRFHLFSLEMHGGVDVARSGACSRFVGKGLGRGVVYIKLNRQMDDRQAEFQQELCGSYDLLDRVSLANILSFS